MTADQKTASPPKAVFVSAALTGLMGLVAVGFGIAVAVAFAVGRRFPGFSAPGTAVTALVFGGALLAAGYSLAKGKTWGRGLVVVVCVLLAIIAGDELLDSQQPLIYVPLGLVALVDLGCLFTPSALRWTQENRVL